MPGCRLLQLSVLLAPCLAVVDEKCFDVSQSSFDNKGERFEVIADSCLLECRVLCQTYPGCSSFRYNIERAECALFRIHENASERSTKTTPNQLPKVTGRCSVTNCSDDCVKNRVQRIVCAEVSKTTSAKPKCGTLPSMENMTWETLHDFPQVALVQCVPGYVFCGKRMTVRCKKNGTWENTDGKCVPVLAHFPLDTAGNCSSDECIRICTVTATTATTTTTTSITTALVSTAGKQKCNRPLDTTNTFTRITDRPDGTYLVMSCSTGFFCGTKKIIKCLPNGHWEKSDGKCKNMTSYITRKSETVMKLPCKFSWALELLAKVKSDEFTMGFKKDLRKVPLFVRVIKKAALVTKTSVIHVLKIRSNGRWLKTKIKKATEYDVRAIICPRQYIVQVNNKTVTKKQKTPLDRIETTGDMFVEIHEGKDCRK